MSSNKSETKINMLASKYRKYQNKKKIQSRRFWKGVARVLQGCQCAWEKVMPVGLRGWCSDYEEFNHNWQSEYGKKCALDQVSKLSIEDTLMNNRGAKMVLALLYSPSSFRTVSVFLSNVPLDRQRNVLFCPLNIEESTFQTNFQDKVGFYNESVLVLWQGLFDEQMVLGKVRLTEMSIWEDVSRLNDDRATYQLTIKKKAAEERDHSGLQGP